MLSPILNAYLLRCQGAPKCFWVSTTSQSNPAPPPPPSQQWLTASLSYPYNHPDAWSTSQTGIGTKKKSRGENDLTTSTKGNYRTLKHESCCVLVIREHLKLVFYAPNMWLFWNDNPWSRLRKDLLLFIERSRCSHLASIRKFRDCLCVLFGNKSQMEKSIPHQH